jgi:hypothetical protein
VANLKRTNPYDDEFFADPKPRSDTASITPAPAGGAPIRLNLNLGRAEHKAFKRLCLEKDVSVSEAVRLLIARAVAEEDLPTSSSL